MPGDFDSIRQILRDSAKVITTVELQERLFAAINRLDAIQAEFVKLQQENAAMVARCAEHEAQKAARPEGDDFIEHRGVLFKTSEFKMGRAVPYCIACTVPLSSPPKHLRLPLRCPRCKFDAPFRETDLPGIFQELTEQRAQ